MTDAKRTTFQSPKGTRDFYPQDLLRRRYIIDTWRRVSLRHGFEEIDGPTFEDSALYTVKSGEGILNELFGAYSGKDPNDTKQVQGGGPPPFALRPEFTPTLARMYAARAKQLPQPTKWFCVSNFFRAERPQRGRLREFWQWNADILGGEETARLDASLVSCAVALVDDVGLSRDTVRVKVGNRAALVNHLVQTLGVHTDHVSKLVELLDEAKKIPESVLATRAVELGFPARNLQMLLLFVGASSVHIDGRKDIPPESYDMQRLWDALEHNSIESSCDYSPALARGLAYYTGTVFELIAEGERAVAGGGRYDKLIELFGGPPTPAVGFGMGDVVLTNLLDDRKLMPEGRDLLEATSRPLPVRPDVFVIANESEDSQARLVPTVAALRRGVETDKYKQGECKPWSTDRYAPTLGGTPPLHARRSYKATKNIGKLLSEATACHARYALIIENADTATLKNLDTGEQTKDVPLTEAPRRIASSAVGQA